MQILLLPMLDAVLLLLQILTPTVTLRRNETATLQLVSTVPPTCSYYLHQDCRVHLNILVESKDKCSGIWTSFIRIQRCDTITKVFQYIHYCLHSQICRHCIRFIFSLSHNSLPHVRYLHQTHSNMFFSFSKYCVVYFRENDITLYCYAGN